MVRLIKSIFDGYVELFADAPMCPPASLYDYDQLPGPERDAANLAADWQRVGGYFRTAMAIVNKQYNLPDFEPHEQKF